MTMRIPILISAAIMLAACNDEPASAPTATSLRAADARTPYAVRIPGNGPVDTSAAAQEALLSKIAARVPARSVAAWRTSLSDPYDRIVRTSSPELATLIGEYYAVRDARLEAAAMRSAGRRAQSEGVPFEIGLLSKPLAAGAKAVIVRQSKLEPHLAIILGSDADIVTLGAAIKTLRRQRALNPGVSDRDARFVIQSAGVRNIGPRMQSGLERELNALRSAPTMKLGKFGDAKVLHRMLPLTKASDL